MSRWEGKERALRRMTRIPQNVRRAARVQLEKNAVELVTTIKSAAPVDDGLLQSSIMQEDSSTPSRISRTVSAEARDERGRPYGRWVEFGHSGAAPRPFFWPIYRLYRRRFRTRMSRAARKAIRESFGQ